MTESPYSGLYPINDCVLVELKQSFKNVAIKEGKYDTRTEGVVIKLPKGKIGDTNTFDFLLSKIVHFDEFKEGSRIKRNGKLYAFIKIEDIRGYEDNEQAS